MLTTEISRSISENVVTDVNANLPAPDAPRHRTLSPEAALLLNKSIVARPLMVPEVCSIRVKNTEYRYRWVNKAGRNGAMYMQRRAQGFVNATTDDVEVLGGDATSTNSAIEAGDVILMKIRADLYDGAMKWNMQKAAALQRTRGMYLKGASSDIYDDGKAAPVTVAQENTHGKASAFIPVNADELMDRSAKLGGAELAREQTNEIREKIKADVAAKVSAKEV